MEKKNFIGLDGLKNFWTKAKAWIIDRITAEVTAKIAEIVAEAPDDLNTLKEIADWISTHEDSASAMNTAILANTEAISGKADKSHTHTKSQITDFPTSLKNPNALTINGKTYDGSTAVDAGVQTVANGGTGVTTQAEINKAFIGNLDIGNSDVTDSTEFVSSYASDNGFSDTNAINKPYKRKFSTVWNYIKGKADSIYAALSHTHTKSEITDFPTSLPANGGTADSANNGFNSSITVDSTPGWGYLTSGNGYSNGRTYSFANGGGIATAEKDTKSSLQVDGDLYVHEGLDKVATLNDIPTSLPANGGTADRVTAGINYSGEQSDCISAKQTAESFNNSEANWASYIICNHGDGETYYHQILRLPFFSDTIQLQRRVNGELKGWKNIAILENSNTWTDSQVFDGLITTKMGSMDGKTVSIGRIDGFVTIGDSTNTNGGYTTINNDCKMLYNLEVSGKCIIKNTSDNVYKSVVSGEINGTTLTLYLN